jgi:hypothetical protein
LVVGRDAAGGGEEFAESLVEARCGYVTALPVFHTYLLLDSTIRRGALRGASSFQGGPLLKRTWGRTAV